MQFDCPRVIADKMTAAVLVVVKSHALIFYWARVDWRKFNLSLTWYLWSYSSAVKYEVLFIWLESS